jgi:periplasmic divalent cation tolerance protein
MFRDVYITAGNMDEARMIARELVSSGLAACVNMFPISSTYLWEGELEEEQEVAMLVKTTEDRYKELEDMVRSIHSYDVPCIVSWELKGDRDYLDWVFESTHK